MDKLNCVKIKVDDSEIKEAIKKTNRLKKLLKEVNSLINELTSRDLELHIKF